MFKILGEKKKYFPILLATLLSSVGFQLAFKPTIDAWRVNANLKHDLSRFKDHDHRPQLEQRKRKDLDNLLKIYRIDTPDFRSRILSDLSALAERHKVRLVEVPQRVPSNQTAGSLGQQLAFEGDYFSLLKFLSEAEHDLNLGFIREITLKSISNSAGPRRSDHIILELYLSIVTNENSRKSD